MAGQSPAHWVLNKHWSVTERPEVHWDRKGRLTGFIQTVKADTTTLEYRKSYRQTTGIMRLKHRLDGSWGRAAGSSAVPAPAPGAVGLSPTRNLLGLAVILTFELQLRP